MTREQASRYSPSPAYRQGAILGLAVVVWALWSDATFGSLLLSYVIALVICNLLLLVATPLWPPLTTRTQAILLFVLLAAAPVTIFVKRAPDVVKKEWLGGLEEKIADRLRLEASPAIAPQQVFTDHPQRFYAYAPGVQQLELRWNRSVPPLGGVSLGSGLFRIDYDPRVHGLAAQVSGPLVAELSLDGDIVKKDFTAVSQQRHPRWFASAPRVGLAATVSEETDELFIVRGNAEPIVLKVGDGPTGCVFFAQGTALAVTHRYAPELWIVDPAQAQVVKKVTVDHGQVRIAASPDDALLAVAVAGTRNGIRLVSVPAAEPGSFLPLSFSPDWVCFGRTSGEIVVSCREDQALHRLTREAEGGEWRLEEPLRLSRPVVTLSRGATGDKLFLANTGLAPGGAELTANHYVLNQLSRRQPLALGGSKQNRHRGENESPGHPRNDRPRHLPHRDVRYG